jgi:tetratricopeptide (TPR) repeat protein
MQNRRLWVFRLITFIGVPLLLLAGLEGALRFIAPGHPTDFTTRVVVDGVAARRENARFAWQFFPAGIAREPLTISFPEEKPERAYRIFVLGGSSAQGDPEPTYGFSRILGLMLERRYPGVDFEIINTAMTAINSHVVYPIAREVAGFQGDLFVIYLGNNEVVGPYGAGTVFAPLLPSLPFIRFLIFVKASHIGQNLTRLLQWLGPEEAGGAERWHGMAMFLDRQVRADDPGMEKVYSHFRGNLEDTLNVIRRGGAEVLVSTVATNLRDSAPFASQNRDGSSEGDLAKWNEFHAKGVALLEAGRTAEASAQLLAAEKLDDTHAGLQFLLGRCHWELGESREALRRYRLAQELDTLRFRADGRINRIIRETAADRADEGIFLVDAAKEMEAGSSNGIPGGDLFYEHVHMNFRGNYLLAKSLFQQIEQILPSEVARFREEDGDLPTFEESMHALALTGFDRHRIAAEVLDRLGRPPFTNQLNHDEVMEQAQRREAELRSFTTPEGLLAARREYEQALQRRGEDPWLRHNFAMLLYGAGRFEAAAEQLRIVLASFPQHAVARERLLASLIQMGRFEEALLASREALRIAPEFNAAKYALAVSYSKLGKEDEAIARYRSLFWEDPERSPDINK